MNAVTTPTTQHHPFNEAQWLRILFLIADTEKWLQQLHKDIFYQLPLKQHKKLLRNNWWLSASVLAHILERHYAPMARHPGAGKFTIGVERIVSIIKEAFAATPKPVQQSCNYQRVWDAGSIVGYDVCGSATQVVTVIADAAGRIITAFPGIIGNAMHEGSGSP
ncbi:hypothetical protein ACLOAU_08095 [Niabella sp. CJ426]|uniref:hypothetical protein n=1 Tax=Niabella sp. CJ426 TaxID=3393740 RepID=UPI003CFF5DC6